ncbi:PAS domain S-box protein [Kiritimatiella glycovorans]|uniref:Diguanylate cyclase/phosphodiesterase with PAS/PAC sensors n=1 Tax=Kiritimatiella glycovorans TaxID=1307763 RepID=A0A0G3EGX4_9BACT|nr:PAS domain S-box protein [Kiritimatiella glycovorans]AKJ63379.1 Diguanylate cyclase/phosphodiesterase with PAS/PAC sensors [Kiritimatiella glycovorans]
MSRNTKIFRTAALLIIAYWLLETAVDAYFFREGGVLLWLFPREPHELWVRGLFIAVMIVFSVYADRAVRERRHHLTRIQFLNGVLRGIRDINQIITHKLDRDTLIQQSCDILTGESGYAGAWIVLTDEEGGLLTAAQAGIHPEAFRAFCEEIRQGTPPCVEEAARRDGPVVKEDPSRECSGCPVREYHRDRSGICMRLQRGDRLYGYMGASVRGHYAGDREVQALFEEVANDFAFALERMEADEQLERQATILDEIGDLVTLTDLDGRILYVNEAQSRLFGVPREDLVGGTVEEYGEDEDHISQREIVRSTCENGEWRGEVVNIGADGHKVILDCHTQLIRDREGRPQYLCGVARDITEHRRAEEEQSRLYSAVEQSVEGVLMTDPEGNIEYVNPAFVSMTGYRREEVLGRTPAILKSGRQDEAFYRDLWNTIRSGGTWKGRMINRREDGTEFTEDATISPVRNMRGEVKHYVKVARDITAELEVQHQLQQAQKMEAFGRLAEAWPTTSTISCSR